MTTTATLGITSDRCPMSEKADSVLKAVAGKGERKQEDAC